MRGGRKRGARERESEEENEEERERWTETWGQRNQDGRLQQTTKTSLKAHNIQHTRITLSHG